MTPDNRGIGDCKDCHLPVFLGPWGTEGPRFGGFVDEERLEVAHFDCDTAEALTYEARSCRYGRNRYQ